MTGAATLGVLLVANRAHWRLLVIPILWCMISGLTLWTMEQPQAFAFPLLAALAVGIAGWKTLKR